MHIIVVGVNYKTAPVEIREKLTFDLTELPLAMNTLKKQKSILENIIVSTCNRTEIYAVVDQPHTGRHYIKAFLAEWFNLNKEEFSPFLTIFEDDIAVEHLYRVSCGLNSMVVGETQILGQVRSSFTQAQEEQTVGTVFNHLIKQAITLAKRAHSETEIGANAVSVSYAAVELAKKIFGNLANKHVVILGAGKMGELAVQNLHGNGVQRVTVLNRTMEKAEALAKRFSGVAKSMDDLEAVLVDADIVISSTGSKQYVITEDRMSKVEKKRKGRPIFMVDIAVPRDLDPGLCNLDSVFLYDIDDLEGIVEANMLERQTEAEKIEIMIEEEIVNFKQWLRTLGVVPVISALRQKALSVQEETMQSIERKLPHLSVRERNLLNKHTKSIINQLLRDPILKAKEMAGNSNAEDSLKLFMEIFNIEEAVEEQKLREVQSESNQIQWNVPLSPQKASAKS